MTIAQKIIKYLAIAFAIFLIITIISGILSAIYGLSTVLSLKDDKREEIKEMNVVKVYDKNEIIKYLDIDIGANNLTIQNGKNFLVQTNDTNIECKSEDGYLKIKEKSNDWFSKVKENNNVTIYIPENFKFEKVEISTGAGRFCIGNLVTEDFYLNIGAGEAIIENIEVKNAKIDTGAGKLTIKSGNIANLNFELGIGKAEITARLLEESKIETGIGSLELKLLGKESDYKINVTKDIGSIKINGKETINNQIIGDGESVINLNGDIGEIKVDFENKI